MECFRLGPPGFLSGRALALPSLITAVVTVVVSVGIRPDSWLNGDQNIGPTNKVNICEIIHKPDFLRGGASTLPPNPTSIGGGIAEH